MQRRSCRKFFRIEGCQTKYVEFDYSALIPIIYKAETPIIPKEVEVSASIKIIYSFT